MDLSPLGTEERVSEASGGRPTGEQNGNGEGLSPLVPNCGLHLRAFFLASRINIRVGEGYRY